MDMITPHAAPLRFVLLAKAIGAFKHSGKYALINGRWHKLAHDKPAPKGAPQAAHPYAAGKHEPTKHLSDAEWDQLKLPSSNVNAGSFNKQIDKIKQMAESGHVTGILGMQLGTNTYAKKAAVIANHILDLYGVKEKVTPGQKAGTHAAVQSAPADADAATKVAQQEADKATSAPKPEPTPTAKAHEPEAAEPDSAAPTKKSKPKVVLSKKKKPEHPKQNNGTSSPGPEPASNDTPSATANLNQIPWDSLKLPDSNTNAKSHNGKVEQIKAMAYAGDVEGLKAFKAGKNTYGKQQNKLAQTALAAIQEDGAEATPAPQEGPGPKDGDTKQGADGTLVFKNGRWHKQDAPTSPDVSAPSDAASSHPLDALPMPDVHGFKHPDKVLESLKALKDKVKAEGPSALKGVTKKMKSTGSLNTKLPVAGDSNTVLKIKGNVNWPDSPHTQIYQYVEALKQIAAGKSPAPEAATGAIQPMDGWKQTGPQLGSNPGGKFKDPNGVEWYCKFPANEDHAKSEVLAAKLYAAAGIAGQQAKLITKDGKIGIASKWVPVTKATPKELAKVSGTDSGFAVDAWLGNWDVVGQDVDNLQIGPDGKALRVDAGGSLNYRAQGAKKAFGDHVTEIDSLRDAAINPQSAAVFGKMTKADITASVKKVLSVPDSTIHALVHEYAPGTEADKQKLAATLIARKADLAAKFPKAKKKAKKPVFKPEKISEPPSFTNWGGSGKPGPSSKPFLNEANENAVQAIYEAAKTGSIDAIRALSAPVFNKDTGAVTGQADVLEHPSQHVKGYAQQAINEIHYQMNPPKRFRFEGGHPLHAINALHPPVKNTADVGGLKKAGKFIVIGDPGTITTESLALPELTYKSGAVTAGVFAGKAQAAIKKMPATQKQAIKAYTGQSYQHMNKSLWAGNPSGEAKAAAEGLHTLGHEIAPGTVLSRKLSVQGKGLNDIIKSTGRVLQEPAIMSTSIRPTSWVGNVQFKLHVGPGVKGLWVGHGSLPNGGSLSNHESEDEMVLPPNTRLLILSVKQGGKQDKDGFGTDVSHVIEAVVLPTQGDV